MYVRKFSPQYFFIPLCLIFWASSGIVAHAHDVEESCDEACQAAQHEKKEQWKAEHAEGKKDPSVDETSAEDHADSNDDKDDDGDHDGKWTEEERAAWREKWKNFDYSKYKSKHGDPGHVCRRGAKKARTQIEQIDKATTNLVKDQLDAVAEARGAVGNTSDISGGAPAERAAYAVKIRRDIDRIEDKIVKGRPVNRKEIARIPNPEVRQRLMKALEAQVKVESLEQEREQTVKTMKALEKMAVATAKAEADMTSLQKNFVEKEQRPEIGKTPNLNDKGGQSYGSIASLGESGMQANSGEAEANRGQPARSKLREP